MSVCYSRARVRIDLREDQQLASAQPSAIWGEIEEIRRQGAFTRLGGLVREGTRQGYFRSDLDSADLVLLVYIVPCSACLRRRI
jgi:hypothetical protein